MNTQNRRPVIDPLLMVLKSRRVLIALSALLVGLLVMAIPGLEAVRHEILTMVLTLAMTLIGGLSVEDAARAARQTTPPDDLHEQIRAIVEAALDALLDKGDSDTTPE